MTLKNLLGSDFDQEDEVVKKAAKGLHHNNSFPQRQHFLSHETILRFAARKGFHVGVRHRDGAKHEKVSSLVARGLVSGGRTGKYGDGCEYHITKLGLAVLKRLESEKKAVAEPTSPPKGAA